MQGPSVQEAITGFRPLEDDPRTLGFRIPKKPTVLPRQFICEAANVCLDARGPEPFNSTSCHGRIGIQHADDYTFWSYAFDEGRTRRGLTNVVAWF
jgi:hypothetical protein